MNKWFSPKRTIIEKEDSGYFKKNMSLIQITKYRQSFTDCKYFYAKFNAI